MYVDIKEDYIRIYQTNGIHTTEVVGWDKQEWIEDPESVVPAIVNAVNMAHKKPKQLLKFLGK